MLKTPGERRVTSPDAFEESISQGVRQGLFGLGELTEDGSSVTCRFFKVDPVVSSGESEVIIKDSICLMQEQLGAGGAPLPYPVGAAKPLGKEDTTPEAVTKEAPTKKMDHVSLEFDVPRGKVSQLMGIMNFLQSKFQDLHVSLNATEGSMSEEDYVSKVKETLRQLGIDLEEKD